MKSRRKIWGDTSGRENQPSHGGWADAILRPLRVAVKSLVWGTAGGLFAGYRRTELMRWVAGPPQDGAQQRRTEAILTPALRLVLCLGFALEIERNCGADETLQRRLINLIAFVDVDGAPDIPLEAGVE